MSTTTTSLVPVLHSKDELHAQPSFAARRMGGRGGGEMLNRKPLTSEDFVRLRDRFEGIKVESPDAETTKRNLVAIQEKWKR